MLDFSNKVAVITGSANGLGKAIAFELYNQGCHLSLLDVDMASLLLIKSQLTSDKQKITIHKVDISKEEEIIKARLEILDCHKKIDILINNAGVSISLPFDQLGISDFKWLFDINFWGMVYCSKHFLPDLKKEPDSRLVNIISGFALMGFPGKTSYGSSKSAVMGFTNSLKTELNKTSVKVCLVVPPPLNTGLVIHSKHMDEHKKKLEADFLKRNGIPLDKAAQKIVSQVRVGKFRIVVGSRMFFMDLISRLFPSGLHKLIGKNKDRIKFV